MVSDASGSLRQGENCWRIERATRTALIVDADDYFRYARAAMLKAQHRIMLIGWDFDARIDLIRVGEPDEAPATVGDLIYWLVQRNSQLEVYLLRWDVGAVKSLFRGTTIFTLIKWMSHERIHTRLDRAHPTAASHHQKLIVIDDSFAFCGGIDVTGDRWDTREHRDDDPCRRRPNGTPYGAWHDATSALEGDVATALGELARERWRRASGQVLPPVVARTNCWPTGLTAQFENVDVAIARSEPEMPDTLRYWRSRSLARPDRARGAFHLRREPVLCLAQDRRSDRAAAGRVDPRKS